MLLSSVIYLLSLYIFSPVETLYLYSHQDDRGTRPVYRITTPENSRREDQSKKIWPLLSKSAGRQSFYPIFEANNIDDLLNLDHNTVPSGEIGTSNSPYINDDQNAPPVSSKLSNSTDDEWDKIELYTNNHQSMSSSSITGKLNSLSNPHSRQYGSHLLGSPNSKLHSQISNFNKYGISYPDSLNYIYSLLTKPSKQNPLTSLLNYNPNSLSVSSSAPLSPSYQSGYVSSYYSIPTLSNVNNIQQPSGKQQSAQDQQEAIVTQNHSTLEVPSSSSICGRQQLIVREPRIVGGNSTIEGEFPWAVSVQRQGNHHCGGVIVGRKWILTAAHCVRSQLVGNLVVRTGGQTLIRSGNHITSHLGRDYLVEQIIMHDDFSKYDNLTASQMKSSASTNNADIALLKLKTDIQWNELTWPVCFPNKDSGNFSGHDATVIGWGKLTEKSEDFSNDLQKVKLTIIDNKLCQNWFRQAGREMPIDDRIICAGFKNGGKDACHGDSGGPLLSKINGQYVVVGVVSTGIGCARPLLPGLYSRVSSYIDWIEKYLIA